MTQETIEKFLLNVGSSYYQSEAVLQKHAGFSAISRFGIGVLSTFMVADEVQILTVHPEEEFARRLTLPSVVKSYLIKKIPKGHPECMPSANMEPKYICRFVVLQTLRISRDWHVFGW